MEQIDALYGMLGEGALLYESLIKVEYDKYDAVIKDDINELDKIISKEQVFYLKMKGFEQKREKLMSSMNMNGKTLKEIIAMTDEPDNSKLKLMYDRLLKSLNDFKKITKECKTLIEVRLHKIDNAMNKLGEKENNLQGLIVSKKI